MKTGQRFFILPLLALGADLHALDNKGRTPLDLGRSKKLRELLSREWTRIAPHPPAAAQADSDSA